jgi:transposase InsO family protein
MFTAEISHRHTGFMLFQNPYDLLFGKWLKQYNHIRPHQALNMRPPVPETLAKIGT